MVLFVPNAEAKKWVELVGERKITRAVLADGRTDCENWLSFNLTFVTLYKDF